MDEHMFIKMTQTFLQWTSEKEKYLYVHNDHVATTNILTANGGRYWTKEGALDFILSELDKKYKNLLMED